MKTISLFGLKYQRVSLVEFLIESRFLNLLQMSVYADYG